MTDIALQVDQTRTEGLVGASDAGAILGLDPYRSPMDVWLELTTGEKKECPAFVQEAAEWGNILEPVIRGRYAVTRGVAVFVPTHSVVYQDWLRCTPDGYVTCDAPLIPGTYDIKPMGEIVGLVQAKNRSAYKADEWAHGCPAAEEVQCRVEMAVCGLPWDDVPVLIGGNRFLIWRVERDLKLEARILGELHAFWELVQSKTPPDVDGSAAWRDYASSRMRPTKVVIAADESTVDLLAEWKRLRSEREALEQAESEIKTSLLLKMSAAGATKIAAGIGDVSAFPNPSRSDWQAYARSLGGGDIPEKFTKPGKGWQLRSPRAWSNGDDE